MRWDYWRSSGAVGVVRATSRLRTDAADPFPQESNRLCRNKRPGRLNLRNSKKHSKTHQKPSVLCTPPFEKSPSKAIGFTYSPLWKIPITTHRFCVLPPLKNSSSKPIGFVYSPFEKSPTKAHRFYVLPPLKNHPSKPHRFCVLPPLKNHPSKAIGSVYSPLWKITVFGERLFRGGRLFRQIWYTAFYAQWIITVLF